MRDGQVPVVVLNACQSGLIDEALEATVATRLLEAGAAAVVAMSHSVYAVAAAEFMAAFYDALFDGRPLGRAVAAGRRRLHRVPERPSPEGPLPLRDWLVPVVYARAPVAFPQLTPARPTAERPRLDDLLARLRAREAAAEAPDAAAAVAADPLAPADPSVPFVGRDGAFFLLEVALRQKRIALLQGPGGTGKTELARAFARWWRASGGVDGPDHVVFHSFEPGVATFGLPGVVTAIGLALLGPAFVPRTADDAERRALVELLLAERRVLLVWDNFETVAEMPDPGRATPPLTEAEQAELRAFLHAVAAGDRSAVLITSRTGEPWLGGDEIRRLPLGGLAPAEAADYADHLLAPYPAAQARRRSDKTYADLIAWLDGHPLSLRLILPHLETRPPGDLLAALRGTAPLPDDAAAGRTRSLTAGVAYSLAHLDAVTRRLLPALSRLEGVADQDLLAAFSQVPAAPPPFAGVPFDAWGAALAAAARVGLLTPLGAGLYRLHPALPATLGADWPAADRAAADAALVTAAAALGAWLTQQIKGGDAAAALSRLALARRTLGRLAGLALDSGRFEEAQDILQPLNELWNARGETAEARAWTARCRRATEPTPGTAPPFDTAAGALWLFVMSAEANRAGAGGDLAGAEATFDAIRAALEAAPTSPRRDARLAVALHNLGTIAQDRGDLPAAARWYRKSLEIKEALGNRPGMAVSYAQMGRLAAAERDRAAALGWAVRCVSLFDQVPHPMTGSGPKHLVRLTAALGLPALETAWREVTGAALPAAVRAWVTAQRDRAT